MNAHEPVASINGVALHEPGQSLDAIELKERAWTELLRQQAVRRGLLPAREVTATPRPTPQEQDSIERMLEQDVRVPIPDDASCLRHYEANRLRFVEGQQAQLRHILFAVTDGVDVGRLAARAEEVLRDLMHKDAPSSLFAERAREYSNCPSGAQGGDIGWVGPRDCAPEFAGELFLRKGAPQATGLRPRLVHTRYGLHIVEVLAREDGRQLTFDEVRARIAFELAQQARATALHQYIRVLAGAARVEGVDVQAAESPLVQ